MIAAAEFVDDSHLHVGEARFFCDYHDQHGPEGYLPVMKTRAMVERLLRICTELEPRVVVEVGVQRGGSTALLHALTEPDKLVAIELTPEPPPALAAYIERSGLGDVVRPHFGVDQADRDTVAAIMATELGGRPIDLVLDDASHLLEETRATFEVLFPLLRPGGAYVIEDWNADHLIADAIQFVLDDPSRPDHDELVDRLGAAAAEHGAAAEGAAAPKSTLVRLPLELVLARARSTDAIREVTVMDNWIVVRRGEDPLEPGRFRLADLVSDHFRLLQG